MGLSDPPSLKRYEWAVRAADGLSAERYDVALVEERAGESSRLTRYPRFGGIPVDQLGGLSFDEQGDLLIDARYFYRPVAIAEDNRVLVCQLYEMLPGTAPRFGRGFTAG
jgi:hypothetical protein